MKMQNVTVFVADQSPESRQVELFLESRQVGFKSFDVGRDAQARTTLMQRAGSDTVPVVIIGELIIRSYAELVTLGQLGKLDAMLGR
jgi:glutaredoxin